MNYGTLIRGVFSQSCRTLAIAVLLAVAQAHGQDLGKDEMYTTAFPDGATNWRIILPTPDADMFYSDAKVGIFIVDVICDGVVVKPRLSNPVHTPILDVVRYRHGRVIYQFSLGFFESWDSISGDPNMNILHTFNLPTNANSIEVAYRVRFPNGQQSAEMKIRFIASHRPINFIVSDVNKSKALTR